MFTGIIETVARIRAIEPTGGDLRLTITAGAPMMADVRQGESIAVSGVCLTVASFDGDSFIADVSTETLARTTLGRLTIGAAVNLERALRVGDRLGGHLVSGHVDGIGHVRSITPDARAQRLAFDVPPELLRYIAEKGSIAIDGVSLTVNAVDDRGFEVTLIPHTIAHTAFAETTVGAAVNLEVDQVARYVERLLARERNGGKASALPPSDFGAVPGKFTPKGE